jgi:hypothetical protein
MRKTDDEPTLEARGEDWPLLPERLPLTGEAHYFRPVEPARRRSGDRLLLGMLVGASLVVLIAIAAGGGWLLARDDSPLPAADAAGSDSAVSPTTVTVPAVVRLPSERARARLVGAGLRVRERFRSTGGKSGVVLSHDRRPAQTRGPTAPSCSSSRTPLHACRCPTFAV